MMEKFEIAIQPEIITATSAFIEAPGKIGYKQIEVAPPTENQARVKISGCGICASSLPLWEGRDWFEYPYEPGAPGHEAWGTIEAVGKSVKGLYPGDFVTILSYRSYAEYDVVNSDAVVKIPIHLKNAPMPGEPLGCAMNIFKRSDISKGQTVAIIGIGFLGALLTQLAKNAGARVIAISQRDFSLKVAAENGADQIIKLNDHWKIIEEVKELTDGAFCDRVIEATGKEWPLNLAGELTKERGKLIIAGYHQDGMRQVNIQLWNWRGLDVINAHERDPITYVNGIENAIAAIESGIINPTALYTHILPFSELGIAFNLLKNRPEGFVKALLVY